MLSLGGRLAVGVNKACRNARSSAAVATGENYSNQRKVVPNGALRIPIGSCDVPEGSHGLELILVLGLFSIGGRLADGVKKRAGVRGVAWRSRRGKL